ncbi:MAG: transcriptional regulator [Bdellovibrionales bacterium]|jgi:uncharacterized protein|nr:transcriptional regulator [Bdellovibrionales bacterium]MBT3526294.1 transcriptional regulator [Bdellovibrionales bacterium]MBT7670203.1 transcriptional regulator [Bdellovibrionales bacterium]MBT7765865.1 transcriptional regulator [Bdellovibrionales bacterium]
MLKLSIVVSLLLATPIFAGLQSGQTLPSIEISGESGGLVAGGAWKSQTLVNKVHVLFYVDPDEKESNLKLEEALSDAKFPRENYQSVAIINMAATWLPNFAIASSLESKQKKYPNTIYVKDLKKVLVSGWGMGDDSYNVLILSKQGKILFYKKGTLNQDEINLAIKLINENL